MHTFRPKNAMTETPAATRAASRRKSRSSGQVVVIFAGAMLLLMGMTAIVVDVSWYWVNSLRIQRAADAAALAGAVQLPNDPNAAFALAKTEATKNGYTKGVNGADVTTAVDLTSTRRLDVSIKAPVGMFFMRVFGINSLSATRTSKAEFTLPVPMGSPQNYYGVGVLNIPVQTFQSSTPTTFKDANNTTTGTWNNAGEADSTINTGSGQWAVTPLTGTTTPQNPQQQWTNFDIQGTAPNSVPNGKNLAVDGIELRSSAFLQGTGAATAGCAMKAELSWNNGTTWTTPKQTTTPLPTTHPTSAVPPNVPNPYDVDFGGATDDWGHTWSYAELANNGNPSFRVRLTFVNPTATCTNTRRLDVDTLEVRVWYEYILIGAPQATDIFDPYGTTILRPQNFWGGMQSQGSPSVQGDAYMTGYETRKSTVNAKYDPITYYNYGIDMPANGGEVWLFDPGFCDTSVVNGINDGTGETWAVGGSAGASTAHPVSAQYELFQDDKNTPYDITDDTLVRSSGTTFKDSRYYDADLGGTNPGGGTNCAEGSATEPVWHDQWWKLASGLPAGRYRLHSTTRIFTSPRGSVVPTMDPEDQTDATALNAFAIWTTADSGTPHVYGLGAMEAWFPLPANQISKFYLAQVEKLHAGKWMDIDLWDPGDTNSLSATLLIEEPTATGYQAANFYWNSSTGTVLPSNFTCGPTASRPNPQPSIVTNSGGSQKFGGQWLRLCVHLSDGYDAPTPPGEPGAGWWKIYYQMGAGSSPATDLTTWQVTIRGNPVHLVIP